MQFKKFFAKVGQSIFIIHNKNTFAFLLAKKETSRLLSREVLNHSHEDQVSQRLKVESLIWRLRVVHKARPRRLKTSVEAVICIVFLI